MDMDGAFGSQTAEGVGAAVKPQKKELGKWQNFLSRGYVCRFKQVLNICMMFLCPDTVTNKFLQCCWEDIGRELCDLDGGERKSGGLYERNLTLSGTVYWLYCLTSMPA